MERNRNWKENIALPTGTVLHIGYDRYTITDIPPRFGGSSIFYQVYRENSSLPYGLKECCPIELEGRLRRVNGLLTGTDEKAGALLSAARARMCGEVTISQRIAAQSGRTIPVLEAPEDILIEMQETVPETA